MLLQKALELNKGTHKHRYWICSDKSYCLKCKYASEICMYGEEKTDYIDKTPCANAFIKKHKYRRRKHA